MSPERAARRGQVLAALRAVLPPDRILHEAEDTAVFESDGMTIRRRLPLAVAMPRNGAEVRAVLRACHQAGVPVVARGAGTGLSGGALPHEDGVLLSLASLNRILAVDPLARVARVECGVRNLAISEAAAAHGLFYAPDPSSQIACSIGGNVAENAGGVHCLKYGLTLHNVLEVAGYTAAGETLRLGARALDAPGLDLLALVTGSEGLLAVVTEVTVRLLPRPQLARCLMASFATVEAAAEAVAGIIAEGLLPAGLELMDGPMTAAAEAFVHAGYDLQAAAILLCESDGTPEEVAEEIARMRAVLGRHGATRVEESRDEAERLRFWSGRKNAFPASGRLSPDYLCMDSTIPRRHLARMLREISDLGRKHGLRCVNVFHAGDGNLHPLILFDSARPGEADRAERFGTEILEASVRLGGTISGEHGVGVEKLDAMCVQFSDEEREQMYALRRAFDPGERLNPGKLLPSLHRCAEHGRMHVRNGRLPHPGLPRF